MDRPAVAGHTTRIFIFRKRNLLWGQPCRPIASVGKTGTISHAGRPTLQRSVSRTAITGIGSTIGYGVASRACCRLTRCGALQHHPDGAVPIGPAASPGNITQIGSSKGIVGNVGQGRNHRFRSDKYYWQCGHCRVCRLGHRGKALGWVSSASHGCALTFGGMARTFPSHGGE